MQLWPASRLKAGGGCRPSRLLSGTSLSDQIVFAYCCFSFLVPSYQWSIWTGANTRTNWIQNGGLAYIGNYRSYLGMVHWIWTGALEWIWPEIHATPVQIDHCVLLLSLMPATLWLFLTIVLLVFLTICFCCLFLSLVVLVMNACIFMLNIHLIHKCAKNIHDLNAYNKYSLYKLYCQS